MRGNRIHRFVLACAASISFGCVGEAAPRPGDLSPKSFKECVESGGAILKSFPAQCVTRDGARFVEEEGRPLNATRGNPTRGACKDMCGNGKCEEIVCMAVGCPCAETAQSCPQDCKG